MEHASTVSNAMVTTALELEGYRVIRSVGVVRGIAVRLRSLFARPDGDFQTGDAGDIGHITEVCEKTRLEAFDLMLQHAAEMGANAVVAMRYDAIEVIDGMTEILAYGTAVIVEPVPQGLSFKT